MVCSSTGLYCWCRDVYGNEIPNTRKYMYGTRLSPNVRCPLGLTTAAPTPTTRRMETATASTGKSASSGLFCVHITCIKPSRSNQPGQLMFWAYLIFSLLFVSERFLPERMVCDSNEVYCWCLDVYGNEIPDTRNYMYGTRLGPNVRCPLGETVAPTTASTGMSANSGIYSVDISFCEQSVIFKALSI